MVITHKNQVRLAVRSRSYEHFVPTITSVTDGNGEAVKAGGTTLSISIHITFTGQAGTNPIAGFQCSLDNNKFSGCTCPFVANNLVAYTRYSEFSVRNIFKIR